MEKCPICGGEELTEVVRGYLGNPKVFLKCRKCFKEHKKEEICKDCKI